MTATHRWEERRRLRAFQRRRRRGGDRRGPVLVQRTARGVHGGWSTLLARIRRTVRGDRPLALALLAVVALAVVVISSPLQSYLDGRDRVDHLEVKATALDAANASLQRRVDDLERDTTIELLAREQLGLVRPGEVAYTLMPPESERPRITTPRTLDPGPSTTWHERLWHEVRSRLGG